MSHASGTTRPLTPRQLKTLDELLAIGMDRPFSRPELSKDLESLILDGTKSAISEWTGRSMFVTKSQVQTALRCEGQLQAEALAPRTGFGEAMVVGIVAHRAVQLSHTHPGRAVHEYVKESVIGARASDQALDEWWANAGTSVQSDLVVQITSKLTNFLDDWPPLDAAWTPRFEEPISTKIGRLTLSSRADLVIGRPRTDLRQTMLLVDLKTGAIKDEHRDEAMFYALVATLRYGVAPWRSLIYSLSSGEWTEPDVTEDDLFSTAASVVTAVNSIVATLTESRPASLTAGEHCRWCPVRKSCPAAAVPVQISSATHDELAARIGNLSLQP